jgi:hypothetical protein
MQAEVAAASLRPIFLYEGEFSTGTLRLWSGVGTAVMSGNVFIGAGQLLSITPIVESAELRANGMQLELSGVDSSVISAVTQYARYGKPGRVWFGCFTGSGTIVTDPYLSFSGKLDAPEIRDDGDLCSIRVNYESRLVDMQRPHVRTYTPEDLKLRNPTDKGFNNVLALQNRTITWGVGVSASTVDGPASPSAD